MAAFALGKQRLRDGIMLAIVLWVWPATGWARSPDQQQACTDDAFRLCGPEIPDVARVTACMVRRQAALSPGCRVYFRPAHTVAKPRKPHKSRKPAHSAR
jgi:hypothetical protein